MEPQNMAMINLKVIFQRLESQKKLGFPVEFNGVQHFTVLKTRSKASAAGSHGLVSGGL